MEYNIRTVAAADKRPEVISCAAYICCSVNYYNMIMISLYLAASTSVSSRNTTPLSGRIFFHNN